MWSETARGGWSGLTPNAIDESLCCEMCYRRQQMEEIPVEAAGRLAARHVERAHWQRNRMVVTNLVREAAAIDRPHLAQRLPRLKSSVNAFRKSKDDPFPPAFGSPAPLLLIKLAHGLRPISGTGPVESTGASSKKNWSNFSFHL